MAQEIPALPIQGAEKVVENRNEIEKEDYMTKKEVKKLIIRTAALTSVLIMDKIRKEVMEIMNIEECGECEKKNDKNENASEKQENLEPPTFEESCGEATLNK